MALSNVSVRSGPGEDYPVIGILPAGGSAAIIGRTGRGQLVADSGRQHPGRPGLGAGRSHPGPECRSRARGDAAAAPTATPTPLTTFSGWKGEYFSNPNLQAPPTVVQDDPTINFNWGSGAPAPGVPADNYSVRWSRQAFFEEGNYRFRSPCRAAATLSRRPAADRRLAERWLAHAGGDSGLLSPGDHSLVVEYFKQTGNGRIAVSLAARAGPAAHGHHLRAEPRRRGPAAGLQRGQLDGRAGPLIVRYEWRFGDGSGAEGLRCPRPIARQAPST